MFKRLFIRDYALNWKSAGTSSWTEGYWEKDDNSIKIVPTFMGEGQPASMLIETNNIQFIEGLNLFCIEKNIKFEKEKPKKKIVKMKEVEKRVNLSIPNLDYLRKYEKAPESYINFIKKDLLLKNKCTEEELRDLGESIPPWKT